MLTHARRGFTLVELSIVLMIIGLVIGAISVGRDLIAAAAIRSQISQIERFNAAANTFRVKYNFLPGDLPPEQANQLGAGFFARTGEFGDGDGSGYINSTVVSVLNFSGEAALFWTDLSAAGLIRGDFSDINAALINIQRDEIASYLPTAQLRHNTHVVIFGYGDLASPITFTLENNYQLTAITHIGGETYWPYASSTPLESLAIDQKLDDGLPGSGRIQGMITQPLGFSGTAQRLNMTVTDWLITWGAGFIVPYTDCFQNTTPIQYNTIDPAKAESAVCSLRVKAGF